MGQSIMSQLEHIKSIYIQYNRLDHEKKDLGAEHNFSWFAWTFHSDWYPTMAKKNAKHI